MIITRLLILIGILLIRHGVFNMIISILAFIVVLLYLFVILLGMPIISWVASFLALGVIGSLSIWVIC